jgi:hypothetical protein
MDRKNMGLLGAMVAAVALMRTGESPSPPVPPATRTALAAGAVATTAQGCPSDGDGPWKAAQAYFGLRNPDPDGECTVQLNGAFSCVPANANIKFLVATVPDPDATHLALYFDRNVESLLWAASDSAYSFERYWLPWKTEPAKELFLLQDQQCQQKLSDARAAQPGLLVFHDKSGNALFLFLVGETPTSGLNKDAWRNALRYIHGMAKPDPAEGGKYAIDVVGPGFSGSLAPLKADLASPPWTDQYTFHFISGMATNGSAIKTFTEAMRGQGGTYQSVLATDDHAQELFFKFALKTWKAPRGTAVLAEDATAYGEVEIESAGFKASTYRYPREISRLRNTYQETASGSQAAKKAATSSGVAFTLKDASSESDLLKEKDSVPAFSRLQSPESQQAVLASLSQTLRLDKVDLGGIVATDILDALFLSRFFRVVSPDTRIYTLDSDLLFLPTSDLSTPSGMLSITSFSLLEPIESPSNKQKLSQFPSRYAEGTYHAALALLRHQKPDPVQLWLTAVGHNAYWPIAILEGPEGGNPKRVLPVDTPTWGWFLLLWISSILGVMHCLYTLYLWGGPHANVNPAAGALGKFFRAYPDSTSSLAASERVFLACMSIAGACGLFLIAVPLIFFLELPEFRGWGPRHLVLAGTAIAMLLGTAGALILGRRGDVWRAGKWYPLFVVLGVITTLGVFGIWLRLLLRGDSDTGYYLAYRCLSLTSGVAPNLPLLLLAVGFVWWGCARLKGASMIEDRRRVVAHISTKAPGAAQIRRVEESLQELFSLRVWAPAIPFVLISIELFQPGLSFRSLEYMEYDVLYTAIVLLFYWAVVVAWMQFMRCWNRFREFLQWLERQPLRNAFTRLPKDISWVPLVTSQTERPLYISTQCWECLRAILAFDGAQTSWPEIDRHRRLVTALQPAAENLRDLFESVESGQSSGSTAGRSTYTSLQENLETAREVIVADLQASEWRQGYSDSLDAQSSSSGEGHAPIANPLLVLKEEFVALRYLMYMRYVFRHLRILLGFVIGGFILSVLSMSSYPFQGHHWISGANAVVCLALGLGVIVVFAQMDRDALMSRITATKANKLGATFFLRVAQYGVLPLAAVLSSQFPEINRVLFSWLQPAIDAIK